MIHDNLKPMEDVVSVINDERDDKELISEETDNTKSASEIVCGLNSQYRLLRKKLSLFFQKHAKKQCTEILYITDGMIPKDYILSLQKRYPDKIITVLIPHFGNFSKLDESIADFDYFLQNKQHSAKLYKYHLANDNITIYGVYSKIFSDMVKSSDLYKLENMVHYSVCARQAVKKLKPDIIHSENIPFYLGLEFNKTNNLKTKVLQTIHDYDIYSDTEPFWAAINCLNKSDMNKLCNDKIIRKNIAALFGIKNVNGFSKMKECLEYLYQNFERYRKTYKKNEETNENILINRLNNRVLELFNQAFYNDSFCPAYYSLKISDYRGINSVTSTIPDWAKEISPNKYLKKGKSKNNEYKIAHPFDNTNFRYYREYNKQYLIKEFAEKQIQSKFVDLNLFNKEEVKIFGYLDSFYKGTLLLAKFDNLKDDEIKTVTNAVLKCFELKKNIQVIFNMPFDCDNSYLKSFIDFLEQQPSLNGKWLFIEGEINLPQFAASSDIILLPSSNTTGIEDILYTAIQYGCIPVTTNQGICGDIVIDIFDDLQQGFGFKDYNNTPDSFTNTLLKGLNFYIQNFTSWKILIENAINYDSSWNNDLLEDYNKIYDKIKS